MSIPERQLTVSRRRLRPGDDEGHHSSFVRLHPSTARRLWNDVVSTVDDADATWSSSHAAFSVTTTSGIEFLPLRIRLPTTTNTIDDVDDVVVVYASYNGGDADRGT